MTQDTRHILVVDDNDLVVSTFALYLESQGYRVSTACDAGVALAVAQEDPVDAVITDLSMPDVSGTELIEKLRTVVPDLPAIIVSGHLAQIGRATDAKLLNKPVSLATLTENLRELLSQQHDVGDHRNRN